jgi:hypothetical protein
MFKKKVSTRQWPQYHCVSVVNAVYGGSDVKEKVVIQTEDADSTEAR